MKQLIVLLLGAVLCGCATSPTGPCAPCAVSDPPLKVGVYADDGPGGIGAVEWFRLVQESPEMELHLLDGAAVRAGALDGLDLFVMPGGGSKREFASLGTNGVEKMKSFIRAGGGYVGTCAGCCLLMDEPKQRARVIPWASCGNVNRTLFPTFQLNEKGAAALGLPKGKLVMRYHGGPCMWPTTNVIAGASFESWGTFDAEAAMEGKLKVRMHGATAIVGGTYGKGRVFVTSAHPEYFNSTLYVVQAAIKWVTGRRVTFPNRPRKPRALAVGFVSGGIAGVKVAETALAIDAEPDMDLVLIDGDGAGQRRLDHLDVLVLTSENATQKGALKDALPGFVARGGKVVGVAGGAKALPPGGVVGETGSGVVKTIRGLGL